MPVTSATVWPGIQFNALFSDHEVRVTLDDVKALFEELREDEEYHENRPVRDSFDA